MVLLAEKWGMGENDDYSDEDWGNPDYQRGHSQRQVNFTENGNNCSPCDLEFGDIAGAEYR